MRKKRLLYNTATAVLNQVVTLAFGFIVPKMIIANYSSAANGLVTSITHFLAFFSLMEMGVGGVVKAAFYKPLAEKDNEQISKIMKSATRFFTKIGTLLVIYSLVLMVVFPLAIDRSIGFVSTMILVISIAFSYISQYMFGIVNQLLLTADQKSYIQQLINALTVLLNTIVSILLIRGNASIEMMKLGSSVVLLLRPVLLTIYVRKHYQIDRKIKYTEEPIKQKWNGLANSLAYHIAKHADTVVLTLFSTMDNVSIYYVYHMVTSGLQQLIDLLTVGMASLLGDMYARQETDKLNGVYSAYECIMHMFVTLLYTIAGITVIPFVRVYTKDVTDVNYVVPLFAILLVASNASYCLRLPYNTMVQVAGHFKETQTSAILEAVINVVLSVILVWKFGLVGVAIGTLVAMTYRTVYFAIYLSRHIINRPFKHFLMHLLVDLLVVAAGVLSTRWIELKNLTYPSWILMALIVGIIVLLESIVVYLVFYRKALKDGMNLFLKKGRKTK